MRIIKLSVSVLIYALSALAQPQIELLRQFDNGSRDLEVFLDIFHCMDDGFLLCGTSQNHPWAIKVDSDGDVIWEINLNNRQFSTVIEADNGDALFGGDINDSLGIVRVNGEGELLWRRNFAPGHCRAIIELKDGDFIACGLDGIILRFDAEGQIIWMERFIPNNIEGDYVWYTFESLRETEDGIIAAGFIYRSIMFERSEYYGWLLKFDFDGEEIWSRSYESGYQLKFKSMVSTRNGFALACDIRNNERDVQRFGLIEVNGEGQVLNMIRYEIGLTASGITRLADGGFCIVGFDYVNNRYYPLALRISSDGDSIWSINFHQQIERAPAHSPNNRLGSVITVDGDILVASGGLINQDENRGMDALMVRLEQDILGPQFISRVPEDTLIKALPDTTIEFIVTARNQQGLDMEYRWYLGDSLVGFDPQIEITFESLGEFPVICVVNAGQWSIRTHWTVRIQDLVIASYSPETLDTVVRRGESVDFAVQARAVEGGQIHYLWELDGDEVGDDRPEYSHHFNEVQVEPYILTATAYRGEASDTVMWEVYVRSAVWAWWPREFEVSVAEGDSVDFGVEPFDPESPNLAYRWYLDGGAWPDSAAGAGAEVAIGWDDAGEHSVSVMVRDGVEADSLAWQVRVYDPAGVGGEDDGVVTPRTLSIAGVHPNPFNRSANVTIYLPTAGDISLGLYDIAGRLVRRLASGGYPAGRHRFAIADLQAAIPSGVYFVRLAAPDGAAARKVVFLK